METTLQDIRYSLRSMRKNAGFTAFAMLVMGLGIGANTAVFSVVHTVLLKPLSYRDPDRIVTLSSLWRRNGLHGQVSFADFQDWHDQSTSFAAMAYYTDYAVPLMAGAAAEFAHVARVSPEFFAVFGVEPSAGRLFDPEEGKPGSAGAAVISYAYWQGHYAGGAAALGQTLRVSDKSVAIVGVLPAGFGFPDKTDIWIPANTIVPETPSRGAHNYLAAGRLKPAVSLEQAQAEMTAIAARLEAQYAASNRNKSIAVTPMRDEMVSDVRFTLYLLLGAVAVVLLIASANMANLLLAKATARTREIGIRAAVGASRGRIIRQLVTESAILALAAGAAGLAFAFWGSRALVALAPIDIPRLDETGIDAPVLAFTFVLSAVSSLLFGLVPAFHVSRVDLNDVLKHGGTGAVAGGSSGRMRGSLVVAEIALSVVLLSAAGLLIKSFVALHNATLGFQPENVLVAGTSVPSNSLESARNATRFYQDVLARLASLPGITAVGATRIPPGHVGSFGPYSIDHKAERGATLAGAPNAVYSVVAPGTFAALRIPLEAGRDFNDNDTYDGEFAAVINRALARKAFSGQNPLGRLIFCNFDSPKPMKIVGVAGDVRQYGPAREPWPEIYMAYQQHPRASTGLNIVVRTAQEPAQFAEVVRSTVRSVSSGVPVKFTTMDTLVAENVAAPRFRMLLLGVFAALAVCLAMAGVYGVMAYAVGQRSSEIGLRIALGASPENVLWLVLRQGIGLAGVGIGLGLAGAIAVTRLFTSMLFDVKPSDPMTYAGVVMLLTLAALSASYFPARRATRVEPLVALRRE